MTFSLIPGTQPELTSFFSMEYTVIFLPVCLLFFFISPKPLKRYVLLLESIFFFLLVSGMRIWYLLGSVVTIWIGGIFIETLYTRRDAAVKAAEKPERKAIKKKYNIYCRMILAAVILLNVGTLLILKYTGFFLTNVNSILGTGLRIPAFLMPIGISFYTLQAVSYLFDVYRETIPADHSIPRLMLFLSFFPQIVEGPICRYGQTAHQLWDVKPVSFRNFLLGSQRILYGLLKKIVIADRLNPFVYGVFTDYSSYPGGWVFLAAVCYTIQLYMDFSGSMDAVCGIAQIFGIIMPENFRQPFFSRTISEFWTRWHISLGTWFKDYIFYPITMSKPMKNLTSAARKKIGNHFGPLLAGSIALFCVWFCNGLWHGAAWTFLFFGMYHFAIILTGNVIAPYVKSINQTLHINANSIPYRAMQHIRTCILVVIGELFFRADSMSSGLFMFRRMITDFHFFSINRDVLVNMLNRLSFDPADLIISGCSLLIVLLVSILKERGIQIREQLRMQPVILRWAIWYALIIFILIFGAYGYGYLPVDPMYANF